MRILFVNEKCGYQGGVEQNVAEAAMHLEQKGHRCFLLHGPADARDMVQYQALFDRTYCLPPLFHRGDAPAYASDAMRYRLKAEVRRVVEWYDIDVIYLHKVLDVTPFVQFSGEVSLVRMIHDHDVYCPRRHKYFLLDGQICPWPAGPKCYSNYCFLGRDQDSVLGFSFNSVQRVLESLEMNKRLDRLLVGSRYMKETLILNGVSSDMISILPPVVHRDKKKATALPDVPHILSVGQLIRGKGIDILLHAMAQLNCSFEATIVGTGNAETQLKKLADNLGLRDKVTFTGWVNHDDISSYYQRASVVVVPSRWPEPFGMNGLESMIHSRPVIGFAVGGIPDWIEDGQNGLLVSPQNSGALASAMTAILTDNTLCEKMGRVGAQLVEDRFSFVSYLNDLERYLSSER